jgi:hypothetical protein
MNITPKNTSSYILSVNYGNLQANNTVQSTIFLHNANNFINGSMHTFTAVSSFGDSPATGEFTTLLTIRSESSNLQDNTVKFKLLGSDNYVTNFTVRNLIVNPIAGSTHTVSRYFIWSNHNELIEVDMTSS